MISGGNMIYANFDRYDAEKVLKRNKKFLLGILIRNFAKPEFDKKQRLIMCFSLFRLRSILQSQNRFWFLFISKAFPLI